MRRLVLALLVCLTAALAVVAGELRAAKDPLAGSYIVVFKPAVQQSSVPAAARQLASAHGGRATISACQTSQRRRTASLSASLACRTFIRAERLSGR